MHLAAAGHARVQLVRGDGGEGYPPGAPYDRIALTIGLLEGDSLCLLLRAEPGSGDERIRIRCYGPDSAAARALGERLLDDLNAWHVAGKPTFKTLRLRAYPVGVTPDPPAKTLITKRRHVLAVDWEHG